MADGVVKFFDAAKGFGFIARHDGGGGIFVHISALRDSGLEDLGENDEVSFDIERDRRSGMKAAVSVRVLARGVPSGGAPRQRDRAYREACPPCWELPIDANIEKCRRAPAIWNLG